MIYNRLAEWVIKHLKDSYLAIFSLVMIIVGFVLQKFYDYNFFYPLLIVLLIMFTSTAIIVKVGLKKLKKFKENYIRFDSLKKHLDTLLPDKCNLFIVTIFIFIIITYFVCLYELDFLDVNLLGLYTLFLGGGTFGLALIGYEMYIRLTLFLHHISHKENVLKEHYNLANPKRTKCLHDLYSLSKVLKNASLTIGLLFVIENFMLHVANSSSLRNLLWQEEQNVFSLLPFWIIWVIIFLFICVAFPIIASIQSMNLKKIVVDIQKTFDEQIFSDKTGNADNIYSFFCATLISSNVETSLKEKFFPQTLDKLVYWITTFMACTIQAITIWNFIIK